MTIEELDLNYYLVNNLSNASRKKIKASNCIEIIRHPENQRDKMEHHKTVEYDRLK